MISLNFKFNVSRNLTNGFKNCLWQKDIAFRALQLYCTSKLNLIVASCWKFQFKKFAYTFPIHFECVFNFTFCFWQSGIFWADSFNSKVAQLDETFHLIYILGVVQKVSSTSPSAIKVNVVSKNWLQIRTQGPKLPPGRSRKVTNSTMNN